MEQFQSASARGHFKSYPKKFQRKFLAQHTSDVGEITTKMISKFEKKVEDTAVRCKIMLQFVNKQTREISPLSQYVLNLNSPTWFQDLCLDVRSRDIRTETGININGFTRSDFVKCGRICFVYNVIPMSNHTPAKKYAEDFDCLVKTWWSTNIKEISKRFVALLAENIRNQTLSILVNSGQLEVKFKMLVFEIFGSQAQYKDFGLSSIESLLSFKCNRDGITHKITWQHVFEFLNEKICIPARFILSTAQKLIKMHISHTNYVHSKKGLPLDMTEVEFTQFFTELMEPVICTLTDFTPTLKREIATLLSARSTYGMENQDVALKTLYRSHIKRNILAAEKGLRSHPSYVDPAGKCLDEIPIPFHYQILSQPKVVDTEFKTSIMSHTPLSVHFTPHSIETKCDRHSVIVSGAKPGESPSSTDPEQCTQRNNLKFFKNKLDGLHYYHITDGKEFTVISPYTSHVLDKSGKWHRYSEHFNPTQNVSHLQLLY